MSKRLVAQFLDQAETTFRGGGWFGSYEYALRDLTAKEAAWAPSPTTNSIWQVVNHVTFYTQLNADRLAGRPRDSRPASNDETFGPKGDPADEAGWEKARAALLAAGEGFIEALGQRTDADLEERLLGTEAPAGDIVAHVNVHNAHHLGQIITLRQVLGSWKSIDWT